MKLDIQQFIEVARSQVTGQGTNDLASAFIRENRGTENELQVEISFGVGRASAIPWVAFLGFNQTVTNGIYPVYLYYKEKELLILAYGLSETNEAKRKWNITNVPTIKEYFSTNNLGRPDRYGSSYVFKAYDTTKTLNESEINSDLNKLIEVYKAHNPESKLKPQTMEAFEVSAFLDAATKAGYYLEQKLATRFTASLLTKPFVILTGLAGSGKTKLAQSFVQWICQDKKQYRIIPVGADWTNREPLLGYPNALKPEEYVTPDNGTLKLIIDACNHPELPYFLILDEMNLSHVERYFADFLSVMESKEEIPLYTSDTIKSNVPTSLKIPSNLFIIGTVNIDETTNMFSPKVLDRANTIEFRVTQDEMKSFLANIKSIDLNSLKGKGSGSAQHFLEMANNKSLTVPDGDTINKALIQFFGELKKTGAEFGYRSATEILQLINQLSILDSALTTNQKIDIAVMQKLLPKLHGSRRKLCPILEKLGGFCISGDFKVIKDVFEKPDFNFESAEVIFPISLEKITRMYHSAIDNGFASFAEA